jgi:hypothetical protein
MNMATKVFNTRNGMLRRTGMIEPTITRRSLIQFCHGDEG